MAGVRESGAADEAHVGYAGALDFPDGSFDVVLYRLVLHHLAFQGPVASIFLEAARLLAPGGALVAIEPGLWHPVGLGLALANRTRLGTALHGTPDDIPLSPRVLIETARAVGLRPSLFAVTYGWRRLPVRVQRLIEPLERFGWHPELRAFRPYADAGCEKAMVRRELAPAIVLAAALTVIAATTAGGEANLAANTWVEIVLVLLDVGWPCSCSFVAHVTRGVDDVDDDVVRSAGGGRRR